MLVPWMPRSESVVVLKALAEISAETRAGVRRIMMLIGRPVGSSWVRSLEAMGEKAGRVVGGDMEAAGAEVWGFVVVVWLDELVNLVWRE